MTTSRLIAVAALISALSMVAAHSLRADEVHRIGFMHPGNPGSVTTKAFQEEMRKLGYVEGRNVSIDYRFAKSRKELLKDIAADFVRQEVDVIVVCCQPAIDAAHDATKTIPIVVMIGGHYVAQGFAESLRRPGGNITGSSSIYPGLYGKMLQLFKEAVPTLKRVAALHHKGSRSHTRQLKQTIELAKKLDIEIVPIPVGSPKDFPDAFRQVTDAKVDGVFVFRGGLLHRNKKLVTKFVNDARLPSMFGHRQEAEAGGLMAYGTYTAALGRRAAHYVDKVLKGTSPAELPIEGPTEFDFIVNLKTAKALGITIPKSILLQATKVVE